MCVCGGGYVGIYIYKHHSRRGERVERFGSHNVLPDLSLVCLYLESLYLSETGEMTGLTGLTGFILLLRIKGH